MIERQEQRGYQKRMQPRIKRARPLDGFKLELGFSDGTTGVVDLSRWIVGHGGVFGPLNDEAVFRQVRVEPEPGTVVWPTGADLCPDVLYAAAHAVAPSSPAQ